MRRATSVRRITGVAPERATANQLCESVLLMGQGGVPKWLRERGVQHTVGTHRIVSRIPD